MIYIFVEACQISTINYSTCIQYVLTEISQRLKPRIIIIFNSQCA